jgi:hypothetical protein
MSSKVIQTKFPALRWRLIHICRACGWYFVDAANSDRGISSSPSPPSWFELIPKLYFYWLIAVPLPYGTSPVGPAILPQNRIINLLLTRRAYKRTIEKRKTIVECFEFFKFCTLKKCFCISVTYWENTTFACKCQHCVTLLVIERHSVRIAVGASILTEGGGGWFSTLLPGKWRNSTSLGHDRLLPNISNSSAILPSDAIQSRHWKRR